MPTVLRRLCRWARPAAAWGTLALAGCSSERLADAASPATKHVLRVQGNGAGAGTVISLDASPELSCAITAGALSGVCGAAYPTNSAVALVATPNGTSRFSGWSGACTGPEQCVVDMSQERVVTAAFTPAPINRPRP